MGSAAVNGRLVWGALLFTGMAASCARSHLPETTQDAGLEDASDGSADDHPASRACWLEPPTWSIEMVDADGRGTSVALALDSTGAPHVGYEGIDIGRSAVRLGARNGAGWDLQTVATNGATSIVLALDQSDVPQLAFSRESAWHAASDSLGWRLSLVSDHHTGPLALALDERGVHVAYHHCLDHFSCYPADNAIAIATRDGTRWVEEDVALAGPLSPVVVPGRDFLSANPRGIHFLAFGLALGDGDQRQLGGELVLWGNVEGTWNSEVVASRAVHEDDAGFGYEAAVAVDAAGEPVVAYAEVNRRWVEKQLTAVGPFAVTLARRANGEWRTEDVDSLDSPPSLWGLEVDPAGAVGLLYGAFNAPLRFATNACGAWEMLEVDASVSAAALKMDREGRPLVAFIRSDGAGGGLWLATLVEAPR